jgi:hypothetical protein
MRDELTMNDRIQPIFLSLLLSSLIPPSLARADGGTVRLREQAGAYQVTVFTSPTPFRAGPVDVSVLVQDAAGECVPEARVTVRLTARGSGQVLEYPATAAAATNKLFHAAVFQLPEPGWWKVDVAVEGPYGLARLRFEVEADQPPPRWLQLWPWFAWPALVVALFSVHRVLARCKAPRSTTAPDCGKMKLFANDCGRLRLPENKLP